VTAPYFSRTIPVKYQTRQKRTNDLGTLTIMSSGMEHYNIEHKNIICSNSFVFFLSYQHQRREEKYHKHGRKAKALPDKYLSLTADGVDQDKHNLLHFTTTMKVSETSKCTFKNVEEQLQELFKS